PVLHREIHFYKFHLIAKRDQLNIAAFQGDTQKAAELFQHFVGRRDVGLHKAGDAIHRVEKKMRIQLHAERPQLGVGKLSLQLNGRIGGFAIELVVADAAKQKKDRPKHDQTVDNIGIE